MIDCAKEACPYVTSSDVSYDVFNFNVILQYCSNMFQWEIAWFVHRYS